ncbi:ATP-binding protein [Pararhizobium sp.]|uniref:ATP-binding protein n=1 Tax=Pararhizobium sp. TaxID=1977563 RepID=UPI0027177017|nr:ATP-binding protein [Pararhizobium sp.]MDO9417812.1 ATP-binding protein [Pararhizobium sp.]
MPDIGKAMELARKSSAVAAIAPFIGSIQVVNQLNVESEKLESRLVEFKALVDVVEPLGNSGVKPATGSLRDLAVRLDSSLRDLIQNTREGLGVRSDILELRYAFERRVEIDASLRQNSGGVDPSGERLAAFRRLIEIIFTAMGSESPMSLNALEADYAVLAKNLQMQSDRPEVASAAGDLRDFVTEQARVFELRRLQLSVVERTQYLLASIHALSSLLSDRVSAVVRRTSDMAQTRSAATNAALETGKERIAVLTLVSLLVGVAAALYVLRDLAGNLQAVTNAMSRLAAGDRMTSVPAIDRVDELGSLARAFNIFKEQSFDRETLANDLVEKSRTLEATFANMTDGMSVFDTAGHLVAWNPQFVELNELDPSRIHQGMHFREIFGHLVMEGVKFAFEDGKISDPDEMFRRRQTGPITYEQTFSSNRIVELRSRPMDGGFATIYTDLTERLAMEGQLRQAQRMEAVGQLTSGMAHDFNNLLAAVSGNLQMLEEALQGRADLMPRITRALEAAERGATLTQRLLAFSRQQALTPELTDVNTLLLNLLDLLDYNLGDKIVIEAGLYPDIDAVFVDQAQLENAVLNLIFNSRDAMPDGGTIRIHTDDLGQAVRIRVSDDGSGMSPDVVAHVFEPFFTTKERGRGSGLGLSMVYGFVSQSGGDVGVESAPAQGTTVTIVLPKAGAGLRPRTRPPVRPFSTAAVGGSESILIVEDDRIVRETAVDILSDLGYQTVAAATADQAIIELNRGHFDLLFTDYILPDGRTGDDVAAYAQNHCPDTAILYTSGYPRDKLAREVPLGSDVMLIAKPYPKATLASAIRQALDSRQSQSKRSTATLKR